MPEISTSTVVDQLIGQRQEFLRFVERRVEDCAAAEDILQAAYARAVAQGDSLRDPDSARAWFFRILRNAVIDFYRHRAVQGKVVSSMPEGFDAADVKESPPNLCRCMDREVERLKPEYASVLREVELADDAAGTLEAYAAREGITPGNAAVRAYRARKALGTKLKRVCGSCAGAGCLDCSCEHSQ